MEIPWSLLSVERSRDNKENEENVFHIFTTGSSAQDVV
jgi:hypothetical protein